MISKRIGSWGTFSVCNIAGHHADPKAPWTSVLMIMATPVFKWGSMYCLSSIAASTVFYYLYLSSRFCLYCTLHAYVRTCCYILGVIA